MAKARNRLPVWVGVLGILFLLVAGGAAFFFQPLYSAEVVWVTARTDLPDSGRVRVVRSLSELEGAGVEGVAMDAAVLRAATEAELELLRRLFRSGAIISVFGDPVPPGLLEQSLGIPRNPHIAPRPGNKVHITTVIPRGAGDYFFNWTQIPEGRSVGPEDVLQHLRIVPSMHLDQRMDRVEDWVRNTWRSITQPDQ